LLKKTVIAVDTGYRRLECVNDGEGQRQHECRQPCKASTVRMFLLFQSTNIFRNRHGCEDDKK